MEAGGGGSSPGQHGAPFPPLPTAGNLMSVCLPVRLLALEFKMLMGTLSSPPHCQDQHSSFSLPSHSLYQLTMFKSSAQGTRDAHSMMKMRMKVCIGRRKRGGGRGERGGRGEGGWGKE